MIILLEGPPRAGKSYHAVKDHILPALKAGRHVYARLNGLDHAAIAKHLELPESRVRELLTVVALDEVKPLFTCFGDDPPRFEVQPDSLVVIDEIQDSYPSARQPLPAEQEAFFAKHGHIGLDVVVMTQAMGRIHNAIRQRVERKSVITKMTALGKEDGYSVRFFSVADQMGKFEKISHERGEYDPAIYPLYKGYQPEAKNTGAYTAGSKTVWQVVRGPAIVMGLALVVGVGLLVAFFRGMGSPDDEATQTSAPPPAPVASAVPVNIRPITTEAKPKRSPQVELLFDLGKQGRPRYVGHLEHVHLVEWRDTGGRVLDRFTSTQLVALGVTVQPTDYGLLVRAGDESIIFTAWPLDEPHRYSSQTVERIRSAGPPRQPAEPAAVADGQGSKPPGAVIGAGTI